MSDEPAPKPKRVQSEAEKARARERAKAWYADPENREKAKERTKKWREENREASAAHSRKWREANPDKRRGVWVRSRYGLSLEQFDYLEARPATCDSCGAPIEGLKSHIDHEHRDEPHPDRIDSRGHGRIRGKLCSNCNCAAGFLGDSPERARLLAEYLDRVTDPEWDYFAQ